MCGRYRISNAERFSEISDVALTWNPGRRYNVAPMQQIAVVLDALPREVTAARWGLVPFFAKDDKAGARMINARSETAATSPAFRAAFKKRRCLVPASGFYEWQKVGAGKQPFHIGMSDDEPFAFAGLWEEWGEQKLRTATILTATPNALVAPIHDRMPVILPREQYSAWLSSETQPEGLKALLVPFPADLMKAYPIGARVGSPRNDDPTVAEEVPLGTVPLPNRPGHERPEPAGAEQPELPL